MENNKKMYGQFFTIVNPFHTDAFHKWIDKIPAEKKTVILEPFAGANNICKLVYEIEPTLSEWKCFDILPSDNNAYEHAPIIQRDTIKDFPTGFSVGITNPPYLAKNSATRAGIPFPTDEFDDLYKLAVKIMLENLEYVAAIIPESFVNSGLFLNRLEAVVSLECRMFDDTDCPVCLALFVPVEAKDKNIDEDSFWLYRAVSCIDYKKVKEGLCFNGASIPWKFNDPNGEIGIVCIDNTKEASISFVRGEDIPSSKIKPTSRSITRVSGLPDDINLDEFLSMCNSLLNEFREKSYDAFLTSFKGLRSDKRYRRRLDFANARMLMNASVGKAVIL